MITDMGKWVVAGMCPNSKKVSVFKFDSEWNYYCE